MSRILRSWELMGRSFGVLRSDMELMWLPILSGIACLLATVMMCSGGVLLFLPEMRAVQAAFRSGRPQITQGMWAFMLLVYTVNYFLVIYFNVALVSIASDRLAGGHATINDGLLLAWRRKGKILQWALLAATVGILLRALEDRMKWLGRFVVRLIGATWTLATFFIVPLLAAEDISPGEALARSAELFRRTWGEELAGGFSFGLIFTLLALPGALPPLYGATAGRMPFLIGMGLAVVYWIALAVINSAVQGVFMAALYRYATTRQIPPGFQNTDLRQA